MRVPYGNQVLPQVLSLINDAPPGSKLRLVSGYFDPKDQIVAALRKALTAGVSITLITRGGGSRARHLETTAHFRELGMDVRFVSWLHAKLYVSDREAIATSMNLTENTADNAGDMAVCVTKNENPAGYRQLCAAFDHFLDQATLADLEKGQLAGNVDDSAPKAPLERRSPKKTNGHCIRCGADVALNPAKPLCRTCYEAWATYENPAYKEKFCHACGSATRTSFEKPVCRACFTS